DATLAEHGVHQRGLAVVHVGDDGDIAYLDGAPSVPGEGSLGGQMRHNLLFFRLRHLSFFSAVISSPLFAGGQQKRLQAHSCSPLQESEVFRSLYSIIWGPPLPCLIRNGCVPI